MSDNVFTVRVYKKKGFLRRQQFAVQDRQEMFPPKKNTTQFRAVFTAAFQSKGMQHNACHLFRKSCTAQFINNRKFL